jgi:segregation and condensation protein A
MSTSFAQNAIAVLIEMAERGEIDPWDVQVLDIFDRCLYELALRNQQDLSHSGQAFLYASMLILLKSDSLETLNQPEIEEDFLESDLDDQSGDVLQLPLNLERCLHRRAATPPLHRRRVTLNELIGHLELIANTLENQPPRQRLRVVKRQSRSQAIKAITQLAHEENLSEIAAEVEQFLLEHWPHISEDQDWVDLEALLQFRNDRVGIFWALLFLCSQSKVELDQTEFYQTIRLRPFIAEEILAPSG